MFYKDVNSSKPKNEKETTNNDDKPSNQNKDNDNDNNLNYYNMDSTKANLNLNLIINENDSIPKITNLLMDSDYNEKIINISKLDEELIFSDDRKSKNSKTHKTDKSSLPMIENQEYNNNSGPIINISNLDIPIKVQNVIDNINEQKKESNNNSNSNNNKNTNEINNNDIKIVQNNIKDKGSQRKINHRNLIRKRKRVIYCKIVILIISLIFLTVFIIFLIKIAFINNS